MKRIIDLNEIGIVGCFQFTDNVYIGGATLGVSLECFDEIEFAESCSAIGSYVLIEIDDVGSYFGEVVSILYDDTINRLDVLIKLLDWDSMRSEFIPEEEEYVCEQAWIV